MCGWEALVHIPSIFFAASCFSSSPCLLIDGSYFFSQVKKLERELRMAQAGEGLVKDTTSDTNSSGSAAGVFGFVALFFPSSVRVESQIVVD